MAIAADITFLPLEKSFIIPCMWSMTSHAAIILLSYQVVV